MDRDRLAAVAQLVTVGTAILYGLLSVLGWIGADGPINALDDVLLVVIAVGGVTMGLLYLARRR
ncbi:MAG: hypothetical protein V9E83_10025 [Baekduia sp.]